MLSADAKDAQAKNVGSFTGIFSQHSSVLKALKDFFIYLHVTPMYDNAFVSIPKKGFLSSGQMNKLLRYNFACSDKQMSSKLLLSSVAWWCHVAEQ